MHDSDGAVEYEMRARRIEESVSKNRAWGTAGIVLGSRVDGLGQMDEHDAVVILSGGVGRLGNIITANSKVSTLFGVQRVS